MRFSASFVWRPVLLKSADLVKTTKQYEKTMKMITRNFDLWCVVFLMCAISSKAAFPPQLIVSRSTLITVPSQPVSGTIPVAIPHRESFEEYSLNLWFSSPTNGWFTRESNESIICSVASLPTVPKAPLDFSGMCLSLDTQGETSSLVVTGRADNVWIDLSVLMLGSDVLPPFPTNSQLGLTIRSVWDDSTNEILYHQFFVACGLTNSWLVSSQIYSRENWQPFRVTVQIANAENLSVPFFRVFLNQTNIVWSSGFRLPDVPSAEGGAWLPCMTTNRVFSGVGFEGSGFLDEVVISDSNLGVVAPYQSTIGQAVAIAWPSDYGQRYQVETCRDLATGDWESFGEPIIGNGTTNTVFERTESAPQKFYRVVPLP